MPQQDVQKVIEATAKLCEDLGHTVVYTEIPINDSEFETHFLAIFSEKMSKLVDAVTAMAGKPAADLMRCLLPYMTMGVEYADRKRENNDNNDSAVEISKEIANHLSSPVALIIRRAADRSR